MLKRFVLPVLLALGSWNASPAHAQTPPPFADSWIGLHTYTYFGVIGVDTAAEASALCPRAWQFDFGYSTGGGYDVLRACNPSYQNTLYFDGMQGEGWSTANLLAQHPEWVLYLCDRVTPLEEYDYRASVPNFINEAYREWKWANIIAPRLFNNINTFIFDNMLLTNTASPVNPDEPDMPNYGVYGAACGYYPTATPADPRPAGGWVQRWSGNMHDVQWVDDVIDWADWLTTRLHANGKKFCLQGFPDEIYSPWQIAFAKYAEFVEKIECVHVEGSGMTPVTIGGGSFRANMNFIRDMNAVGHGVYQLTTPMFNNESSWSSDDIPVALHKFAIASYLMAKGHHHAIAVITPLQFFYGDGSTYENTTWTPLYDAIHSGTGVTGARGIGAPCEDYQVVGVDNGGDNQLFKREHTGGLVYMNGTVTHPGIPGQGIPGGTGTTFNPTLPTGNWAGWRDPDNNVVAGPTVSVGPIVYTGNFPWQLAYPTDYPVTIILKTQPSADDPPPACSGGGDQTAPVISALNVIDIETDEATLEWTTDENATGQVYLATTNPPAILVDSDATANSTSHSFTASSLTPGTTYFYRVASADSAGNLRQSSVGSYTTDAAPDDVVIVTTSPLPDCTVGAVCSYQFSASGGTTAGAGGWQYEVQAALFQPASNLTNFPVLVSKQHDSFKSVANGGRVQSPSGYDIVPFAATGATTSLDFDFESWDGATGTWTGWVKIPTLTSATPTVIYFAVGNATATQSSANEAATWGAYKAVYHGGSGAPDATGGHGGSFVGTVSSVSGKVGSAFDLGAAAGRITVADHDDFSPGNGSTDSAFSVEQWVKFTNADSGIDDIVGKYINPHREWLLFKSNTTLFLVLFDESTNAQIARGYSMAWDTGWHHVAVTSAGTGGAGIIFYIDGAAVAQNADSDDGSYTAVENLATGVEIGGRNGNNNFRGLLDEVRFTTGVKAAAWIAANYANQNNPSGTVTLGSEASLGGAGGYSWERTAGNLCELTLTVATATLGGIPSTAQTCNFTLRVTDAAMGTASRSFDLTVQPTPVVVTALPNGRLGDLYNQPIAPTFGVPPYAIAVIAGAFPSGINAQAGSLSIVGTPTVTGNFDVTLQITDSLGASGTQVFDLTIDDNPVALVTNVLPDAKAGVVYSHTLQATGGLLPRTFLIVGSLPAGLALAGDQITGTPTTVGPYSVTVQVRDSSDPTALTDQRTFALNVNAVTALGAGSPTPYKPSTCRNYNLALRVNGGVPPYAWSLAPGSAALPPGLQLSGNSIIGRATQRGTYPVTLRVTDAEDTTDNFATTFTVVACTGAGAALR